MAASRRVARSLKIVRRISAAWQDVELVVSKRTNSRVREHQRRFIAVSASPQA
jgi:hypothetical protein